MFHRMRMVGRLVDQSRLVPQIDSVVAWCVRERPLCDALLTGLTEFVLSLLIFLTVAALLVASGPGG